MARKPSKTLTDGELRIMEVVWHQKTATVNDVTDALRNKRGPAYNTVQTMMRILEDKGYLQHEKKGRSFTYQALIGQKYAKAQALKHLLSRFFNDSPQALMVNLLEEEELDTAELQQLKALIQVSEEEGEHE
ncbi:MAG: BlaI/MecI/CopY family transcriptional regulator [Nitrosomonadaceae bacterium]|jgi:BlaI family penicillinase repressor